MKNYILLGSMLAVSLAVFGCGSVSGPDYEDIDQIEQYTLPSWSCGSQPITVDHYQTSEPFGKLSPYTTNNYDHGGSGCTDMWLMNFNALWNLDDHYSKHLLIGWDIDERPTTESSCEYAKMDIEIYETTVSPLETVQLSEGDCSGQWMGDVCWWICHENFASTNSYTGGTANSKTWGINYHGADVKDANYSLKVGVSTYSQVGSWKLWKKGYVDLIVYYD
jgi:hypothetical protein